MVEPSKLGSASNVLSYKSLHEIPIDAALTNPHELLKDALTVHEISSNTSDTLGKLCCNLLHLYSPYSVVNIFF